MTPGRRPTLSKALIERIVSLRKTTGLTYAEIGQRCGVTDHSVRSICNRAGLGKKKVCKPVRENSTTFRPSTPTQVARNGTERTRTAALGLPGQGWEPEDIEC